VHGKSVQGVPRAQVPNLAVGRQLPCVVDPAKPKRRFVIDWSNVARGSTSSRSGPEGGPYGEAGRALIDSASGVPPADLAVEPMPAPAQVSAAVIPPRRTIAERLQELETLRATGAISDAEYTAKREQIIAEI
jgi:hypothetical protein